MYFSLTPTLENTLGKGQLRYVDRQQSNCYKWDSEQSVGTLPLWVADMDFAAAPCILRAMRERLDHGVFGYNIVPDDYYKAVARWFERKHGWTGIVKENLILTTALVPALSAILRAMQMRRGAGKEKPLHVLTLTPAYNCFFSSISNLDAELVDCALKDEDGSFEIDWEDFEDKLSRSEVLILCNPHNPTGRIWSREELLRIARLCDEKNVFVISDEIHCEIVRSGRQYVPYATVAERKENYCVMTSASKAFNIAGLQCANVFVPDAANHALIDRAVNVHEVGELNPFGMVATIAAYNEGEAWLRELNEYVDGNFLWLESFLQDNLPEFGLTKPEATYLAWVRLPEGVVAEEFCSRLRDEQHVLLNPSEIYGAKGYVRVNLATSREVLEEAMRRLLRFVRNG